MRISILMIMLLLPCIAQSQPADNSLRLSIGLFTDCQSADAPAKNNRQYQLSLSKLTECVQTQNNRRPLFVVQLGDLIDHDYQSYSAVQSILAGLKPHLYNVLGNHDFSVSDAQKTQIPALLEMPSRYYDVVANGWRFIFLDGNELSLYAWPAGSAEDNASRAYYVTLKNEPAKYNGAIGPKQLKWLKEVLSLAEANNQPVVIFCHLPIWPTAKDNLWNASEILEEIESHPCVKAYICGHKHAGNYTERNGVHYLNLKGMVEGIENSFAIMEFSKDQIKVIGFGREPSRTLAIKSAPTASSLPASQPVAK